MCRQGRRFSKAAQATNQCPTSSTSCGYFEFSSGDQKNGNPTTGVYDCVDGGILSEDSGEVQDSDDYIGFVCFRYFNKVIGSVESK